MWAQGLTIGIIIAAGVLTHSQRAKKYDEEEDHRIHHIVSYSKINIPENRRLLLALRIGT